MNSHILVAYATGSGSTAEVAETIATELRGNNVQVDVNPAGAVADVTGYSAVVVGSSIRAGRWLPDAFHFLERFRTALQRVPVAYFTTCLTLAEDTEDNRHIVLAYMEPVRQAAPGIEPIGLGLFAGSFDPGRRAIMQGIAATVHGDYRDWEAIRRWARTMRPLLQAARRPADLQAADLQASDLSSADLPGADLHRSRLRWAELTNSNLRAADLSWANLIGAELQGAQLSDADLSRAILNGANLQGADLRRANLAHADLNWANLKRADLRRATLANAGLGWADLSEAVLDDAVFSGARYNEHTIWPEGFAIEDVGALFVAGPR